MALLRLMMEMVQTGAVDPSVVLEYAPVENREELKERFDTINMQKAKIYDLEEENRMLKQSMINAQNSYVQASLKVKETEAGVKIDKLVSETKIKLMRDKFQSKLEREVDQIVKEVDQEDHDKVDSTVQRAVRQYAEAFTASVRRRTTFESQFISYALNTASAMLNYSERSLAQHKSK